MSALFIPNALRFEKGQAGEVRPGQKTGGCLRRMVKRNESNRT
jgi:hypothetical protein